MIAFFCSFSFLLTFLVHFSFLLIPVFALPQRCVARCGNSFRWHVAYQKYLG